jgi:hypothetical protein
MDRIHVADGTPNYTFSYLFSGSWTSEELYLRHKGNQFSEILPVVIFRFL